MPRQLNIAEGQPYALEEDAFVSGSESRTSRPSNGHASATSAGALADAISGESALAGNLRTMVLDDVLLWVATRRKTGTLHVRRLSTRKRIVFKDGVVHSSSSNDPRETLGQFLVRDGLISEEQLFKALLQQEESGSLLGILLVSDGLLTPEQLKRTLRAKAEQIIYELFLWDEGSFVFQEGLLPRHVPMNLETDTLAVVREGIQRRKRWQRIRERFGAADVTFKVLTAAQPPEEPVQRALFEMAAAGKTLAEISLHSRRSEFETAEYLFALVELRVLDVDRAGPDATAAGADTVGAIEAALALARKRLADRSYDAAFEAYQDVLGLDHLNQEAKKGLIAVSDGRKRQRLARRVAATAVPRVVMTTLQLARERFAAEESFVLSRINGEWDVQSILKVSPVGEEETLAIFARLSDRKVIRLDEPEPATGRLRPVPRG